MPTFSYEAMNQAGQEIKDEVEAVSTEDALAKIRNLGFFPTRIREKGGVKAKARTPGKKRGGAGFGFVSTKAITQFTQIQTAYQASLATGSRLLSLSFLDFLR